MSGWCVVAFRKRTRPDQLCRMSISQPNSAGSVFSITYWIRCTVSSSGCAGSLKKR